MSRSRLFPRTLWFKKLVHTFFPRFLFRISPRRYWQRNHWKNQKSGDIHGYEKYTVDHPRIPVLLAELRALVRPSEPILDAGCNCGYYLSLLKKEGFSNLHGIDISPEAVTYGKTHFDLSDVEIAIGSFEDTLPRFFRQDKKFRLVYSLGATLELVHPSFDIIGSLCRISETYVLLIINEWGHEYPRLWEYEFNKNGFLLVKCIRPFDGRKTVGDPINTDSLLVFMRICKGQS